MLQPPSQGPILGSLPFVITFAFVFNVAFLKGFPALSGNERTNHPYSDYDLLPTHNSISKSKLAPQPVLRTRLRWPSSRSIIGIVFASNIAFATVLIESIFAEITDLFDPLGRNLALNVALPATLIFFIVIAPALELHTFLSAAGWGKGRYKRIIWLVELLGVAAWVFTFWWLSGALLLGYANGDIAQFEETFSKACLVRVAIIGISVMAVLAAFGACSALWQNLGASTKKVSIRMHGITFHSPQALALTA